jgi:hypothetical protein
MLESHAYWIIDSALEGPAEFVADQLNAYDKGVLSGVTQYREREGDCVGSMALVWDGGKFRPSHVDRPGMCRRKVGFWSFPTFVTQVVGEDGSPRDLD